MQCPKCKKELENTVGKCPDCSYEIWKDKDKECSQNMAQKIDAAKALMKLRKYSDAKKLLIDAKNYYEEFENYRKNCPTYITSLTDSYKKEKEADNLISRISDTKKNIAIAIIVSIVAICALVGVFIDDGGSSSKECIYCDKTISSGSVCSSCKQWLNDADDAAKDYGNKYN